MPMATREEQREYQREWMAERRASYLQGAVCVDCGSPDRIEIDHRDPAQKVSHRIWSWTHERIREELAKCDLRCRPCHQARHGAERRIHGTVRRYEAGCRCEPCRAAKAVKNARYRARVLARSGADRWDGSGASLALF